jgi:hypothetical protein
MHEGAHSGCLWFFWAGHTPLIPKSNSTCTFSTAALTPSQAGAGGASLHTFHQGQLAPLRQREDGRGAARKLQHHNRGAGARQQRGVLKRGAGAQQGCRPCAGHLGPNCVGRFGGGGGGPFQCLVCTIFPTHSEDRLCAVNQPVTEHSSDPSADSATAPLCKATVLVPSSWVLVDTL